MKKYMSLILAWFLALCMVSAYAADYTVAEKFALQVAAGSGVSGEIQVDWQKPSGESLLAQPFVMEVNYIQRLTTPADNRLTLVLTRDEKAQSTINAQFTQNKLNFHADVLSPDWYTLDLQPEAAQLFSGDGVQESSAPTLEDTAVSLAYLALCSGSLPASMLEELTIQLDLWLEAYRDEPVLEDGTLTIHYSVPPEAIQAEVKALVAEMLENTAYLDALNEMLGENAALYANPSYLEYYNAAMDALPLEGSLELTRVVTLKGETHYLKLFMPLSADVGSDAGILYERTSAQGDEPQQEKLELSAGSSSYKLLYNRYRTEELINVCSGSLSIQEAEEAREMEFTFSYSEETAMLEKGEECYTVTANLTLIPGEGIPLFGGEMSLGLVASFTSASSKKAATQVEAALTLVPSGQEQLIINVSGKTRAKWEEEELQISPISLEALSSSELLVLLSSLGQNFQTILSSYTK